MLKVETDSFNVFCTQA